MKEHLPVNIHFLSVIWWIDAMNITLAFFRSLRGFSRPTSTALVYTRLYVNQCSLHFDQLCFYWNVVFQSFQTILPTFFTVILSCVTIFLPSMQAYRQC